MDRAKSTFAGWWIRGSLYAWVFTVAVFLAAPVVMAGAVAFNGGNQLVFPPHGFSLRWFKLVLSSSILQDAFARSALIAAFAAVFSTASGIGAAIGLRFFVFRGRATLRGLIMLPLTIPGIALGLAILSALPLLGLSSGLTATIIAHSVIGLPYVTYLIFAGFSSTDRDLWHASMNLGANEWQTIWRIILPRTNDGAIVGFVFAFLVSFDNVSISIFLTKGDTLPLRLMQQMDAYADPTVSAASLIIIGLSIALLAIVGKKLEVNNQL